MNTSIHCHIHHYLPKCVLSICNRDVIPQITLLAGKSMKTCSPFFQHCWLKIDSYHVFGCRCTNSNKVRCLPDQSYVKGDKLNFSVIILVTKQMLNLPKSKATYTVRDERIDLLVRIHWKCLTMWRIKVEFMFTEFWLI